MIKPLVTEKHYCHHRDMSILVAVLIFVGKKCWLITIKKKAKVRLWRRIQNFIEFHCDYLYFQAFWPPMIPMPWTKLLCSQTKKLKKRQNLLIDSLRERSGSKDLEKKELGDRTDLKLKAKINLWHFRNKSLAKEKRKRKVSQVFCLINKTTDGYLDGGIDDMRYWNTISWT